MVSDDGPIRPSPGTLGAAITATAALLLYLFILRDLALIELARPLAGSASSLYGLVSGMGASGALGCVLAAAWYRPERVRGALAGSFAVCAGALVAARLTSGWDALLVAALVAALAAGGGSVMLAMALRGALGSERLGLWCGFGVGTAYAVANLPWVYRAPPPIQTWIAVVAAVMGAGAAFGLRPVSGAVSLSPDYRPRVWLTWVVVLLVLAWLDKSSFRLIRAAAAESDVLVSGTLPSYEKALLYFLFAVLTGLALDRGWADRVLLFATAALLAAGISVDADYGAFAAGDLFHAAGKAVYTTALVMYPARSGRPWLAAGVLAIARWVGGALGAGMALAMGDVPDGLLFAAAAVALGAVIMRARWREKTGPPVPWR